MKNLLLAFCLLAAPLFAADDAAEGQPNILWIVSEDNSSIGSAATETTRQ